MNFNRGDQVIHHGFGVGTVVSIEGIKLTSDEPRPHYRVVFNKTTVWVPVYNQPAVGLRPITPKGDLPRYRDTLKKTPVQLDDDLRLRQRDLEKRIDIGTFQALCEVVRDLNAWTRLKPLNNYEKVLLKQAREALVGEWSATSGLAVDQALEEIEGLLLKGMQRAVSG